MAPATLESYYRSQLRKIVEDFEDLFEEVILLPGLDELRIAADP